MTSLSSNHSQVNEDPALTDVAVSTAFPLESHAAPGGGADLSFPPLLEDGEERKVCLDEASRADRQTLQGECQAESAEPGARPAAASEGSGAATSVATSVHNRQYLSISSDTPYAKCREFNSELARVLRAMGRFEEAERVSKCHTVFKGYIAVCCKDEIAIPRDSCNNRLCAFDNKRRAARLREKIGQVFDKFKSPRLLTLTIGNVDSLVFPEVALGKFEKDVFSWLRKCFGRLRRRRLFKSCRGGLYSIETTYNLDSDTWHVHLHALIDSDYIPQAAIVEAWKQITGGSFIVDIRACDRDSIMEVIKYVAKGSTFLVEPERVAEYLDAVRNMSLIERFGFLRDIDFESKPFEWPTCSCGSNEWDAAVWDFSIDDVYLDCNGFWRPKIKFDTS